MLAWMEGREGKRWVMEKGRRKVAILCVIG